MSLGALYIGFDDLLVADPVDLNVACMVSFVPFSRLEILQIRPVLYQEVDIS